MATKTYSYKVSTDFPGAKVNSDLLTKEIVASSIATVLHGIHTYGDVCDISFVAGLSAAKEKILAVLIGAHQGNPSAPTPGTQLQEYTVANLPLASDWQSCPVVVTDDAVAGMPVQAMSDGTNWRRVFDNGIVG